MSRSVFEVQRGSSVLARVPLLPALASGASAGAGLDPVLVEGLLLSVRQEGAAPPDLAVADAPGRVALTVRAYETRARWRPTPHGVFAGVALAEVGGLDLRLGGAHRARTVPGAAWLAAVADRALELPGVAARLRFTTSNLIRRRGSRLEHEQQAGPGPADVGELATVRATPAVTLILDTCHRGAGFDEVVAAVRSAWPTVAAEVVERTLVELCRRGFLSHDLLPMSFDDALGHLLGRLPGDSALVGSLRALRERLVEADRHSPGAPARRAGLVAARSVCDGVLRQASPLRVDVAMDATVVLPSRLVDEAADAAGVLWRVSDARATLAGFHERFLDRFGRGRLVPLLDLTDPVVGLGDFGVEIEALPEPSRRRAVLAELLHRATATGSTEVVLDPATVEALDRQGRDLPPPPTAEIYARVLAESEADLARGELFLAVYVGGAQEAGSTLGRFVSLLPQAQVGPARAVPGSVLVAEVVVRPRTPGLVTVTPPTGLAKARIPVGVPAEPGDLRLDDLLVGSDGQRLVLWSGEQRCPVLPVVYSRISASYLPPEGRLLQLLGLSGCRPWYGWSWGGLEANAFVPRVRWGRTILAPARWRLPVTLTDAAARGAGAWRVVLDEWRATALPQPPRVVVTDDADRHLPLDMADNRDRDGLVVRA